MAKYKFSNKLMFALVMQDEEICAEFIQRLFPGKKVKSITFPNDIKITPEKTIVTGVLSKSVRLDVLFEGEKEVYDIEMQVEKEPAFRCRILLFRLRTKHPAARILRELR